MSSAERSETIPLTNKPNQVVIDVVEESSSTPRQPALGGVNNYEFSHSHSFDIDDSREPSGSAAPSSYFILPSRFRLSRPTTSVLLWFTFIALHVTVFAWLLAIYLRKSPYGAHYIVYPVFSGLILGAWLFYMVLTAVRSSSAQQLPLILDPLLDGSDAALNSPVAGASSASSRWQFNFSRVNWWRYARILFLTACIASEAFLLFIIILEGLIGDFASGIGTSGIPGWLFLLVTILNPFSWIMSYKYA